jgi:hypothetical protein
MVIRLIAASTTIAALALAACGGDSNPSASTAAAKPHGAVALRWSNCASASHSSAESAAAWGGSVAGISCDAAGRIIDRRFLKYGGTGRSRSIRLEDPRTFHSAGFSCTEFPLEDGSGWHTLCDRTDQHISFFFTP